MFKFKTNRTLFVPFLDKPVLDTDFGSVGTVQSSWLRWFRTHTQRQDRRRLIELDNLLRSGAQHFVILLDKVRTHRKWIGTRFRRRSHAPTRSRGSTATD